MVVVPFVEGRLRPGVVAAIEASGFEPRLCPLVGDEGYFELLASLWNQTDEDLVVVEQDIIVGRQTIADLLACQWPWCSAPYPYNGFGLHWGLGCVKFSVNCQARGADLFEKIAAVADPQHPSKHWCRLDSRIHTQFNQWYVLEHRHSDAVQHLGHGVAHGCIQERQDGKG